MDMLEINKQSERESATDGSIYSLYMCNNENLEFLPQESLQSPRKTSVLERPPLASPGYLSMPSSDPSKDPLVPNFNFDPSILPLSSFPPPLGDKRLDCRLQVGRLDFDNVKGLEEKDAKEEEEEKKEIFQVLEDLNEKK
jgi:hypothetical protein